MREPGACWKLVSCARTIQSRQDRLPFFCKLWPISSHLSLIQLYIIRNIQRTNLLSMLYAQIYFLKLLWTDNAGRTHVFIEAICNWTLFSNIWRHLIIYPPYAFHSFPGVAWFSQLFNTWISLIVLLIFQSFMMTEFLKIYIFNRSKCIHRAIFLPTKYLRVPKIYRYFYYFSMIF